MCWSQSRSRPRLPVLLGDEVAGEVPPDQPESAGEEKTIRNGQSSAQFPRTLVSQGGTFLVPYSFVSSDQMKAAWSCGVTAVSGATELLESAFPLLAPVHLARYEVT